MSLHGTPLVHSHLRRIDEDIMAAGSGLCPSVCAQVLLHGVAQQNTGQCLGDVIYPLPMRKKPGRVVKQ